MKVLLDECLDRRLKLHIRASEVQTVQDCGWAGISNGELLKLAQERFDILVTVDQKLRFQQNLSQYSIAVVILLVGSDILEDLLPAVSYLNSRLDAIRKGDLLVIDEVP